MKSRVIYLRDDAAARYDLAVHSPQHPMKPWRLTAVHGLVRRLGLLDRMTVMCPPPMPAELLNDFHLNEYVSELERTSGDSWSFAPASAVPSGEWVPLSFRGQVNVTSASSAAAAAVASSSSASAAQTQQQQKSKQQPQPNSNPAAAATTKPAPSCFTAHDCPIMQGGLEYARVVGGSSLFGAVLLNSGAADTVINWTGGMHHARAGACSGFCYVNDCVLAIRELLRKHKRVMYIDLDVHHGDGVEEAFYDTNQVFTLSLHKFADGFFPGTGHPHDVGVDRGRFFNMNVPLRDGIRDEEYCEIFAAAFRGVTECFDPEVFVVQCGADSLAGDKLGGTALRLSSAGHASCLRMVRDYCNSTTNAITNKRKILALGGGGYTVRHVARLWAYETAVLCGLDEFGSSVGDDDDDDSTTAQRPATIHSRTLVPLPVAVESTPIDAASAAKMLLETSVLLDSASDPEAVQLELERRALMLVFADECMTINSSQEGTGNNRCCTTTLYVAGDGGGFEGRQLAIGGQAGQFRYVQSVLRRISEHVTQLRDVC